MPRCRWRRRCTRSWTVWRTCGTFALTVEPEARNCRAPDPFIRRPNGPGRACARLPDAVPTHARPLPLISPSQPVRGRVLSRILVTIFFSGAAAPPVAPTTDPVGFQNALHGDDRR